MSFDRDRILRRLKAYDRATQEFRSARVAGVAEWEEWTITWRIAVDQTEAYAHRNKLIRDQLNEFIAKRKAHDGLLYIWESGNAERHNPDGSAVPNPSVTISAADPSRPVHLERLHIRNGQIVAAVGSNSLVEHHQGLRLMPIKLRGGDRAPPSGSSAASLVAAGDEYISGLRRLVFPI